MAPNYEYIPYKETGYFSKLVVSYMDGDASLAPFYSYPATQQGIAQAIAERRQFPVNRQALVASLRRQYACLNVHPKTEENIQLLLDDNTFTVCTAHQPNLLTGYLYFVYKILHAIKLADELALLHPGKQFVPVYYMGSEDADIQELGVFHFRGEKFVWNGDGQHGAVGRMKTAGLRELLGDVFKLIGPPGPLADQLKDVLSTAYLKHDTIAAATQYLVNELFGRYGLVVIDPDDASLKSSFIPVMEEELLHQSSLPIVQQQIDRLSEHYKSQAFPRPINLFYLANGLRERIEYDGQQWTVLNTGIAWNKESLLAELHAHPERFSPNVVLRPLFQETILPDVAFIGGGAEVAYWLQLKELFTARNVFFPSIHLRQSVLAIDAASAKLRQQLGLSIPGIFPSAEKLADDYVAAHTSGQWQLTAENAELEAIFVRLKQKAGELDATLNGAAAAAIARMKKQAATLEHKMYKAEKRHHETGINRIYKLKKTLFPNASLQERTDSFLEYYLAYGPAFFDHIKDGITSFEQRFMVLEYIG